MRTIVTATKNTYNAKESLKSAGFSFDAIQKTWVKEFASEEEFEAWKSEKFVNATYAGRKQAKYNEAVLFEILTEGNEAEVKETAETKSEMIEAGKIENFEFDCYGRKAVLDGFFITEVATGRKTDFRLAPVEQWSGLKAMIIKEMLK